jgi:hypothetical protein
MLTEKLLWSQVREHLTRGPHAVAERVENGAGVGMFDVAGQVSGDAYWVELKIASKYAMRNPKTSPWPLLRPSQYAWAVRWGGEPRANLFVLVTGEDGKERRLFRVFSRPGLLLGYREITAEGLHPPTALDIYLLQLVREKDKE